MGLAKPLHLPARELFSKANLKKIRAEGVSGVDVSYTIAVLEMDASVHPLGWPGRNPLVSSHAA